MMQCIPYRCVSQSCSSSFCLLFSQLFLQDGCAETGLLSGNVQWFQDNAFRLCPCNGTIFIFALDCVIFCSWGKIYLELSMLTSNADEWNHISEGITVGAVLSFPSLCLNVSYLVSCDVCCQSYFMATSALLLYLSLVKTLTNGQDSILEQSLAAHRKWNLDLCLDFLLNVYYLQYLGAFIYCFFGFIWDNRELTPTRIAAKTIMYLLALATKAHTPFFRER